MNTRETITYTYRDDNRLAKRVTEYSDNTADAASPDEQQKEPPGRLQMILALVWDEVERASAKYPPFNSAHEGFAVLKEEVDELWDEVKANHPERQTAEAIQVAAMAVRFLMDNTAAPLA